jgi:hypothetical protein
MFPKRKTRYIIEPCIIPSNKKEFHQHGEQFNKEADENNIWRAN